MNSIKENGYPEPYRACKVWNETNGSESVCTLIPNKFGSRWIPKGYHKDVDGVVTHWEYLIEPLADEKTTENDSGWQACPVCNGTGTDPFITMSADVFPKCPTCFGHRIINIKTALPPTK